MSLAIKSTYLNWALMTTLGLALFFRNIGPDQAIAIFLLVFSLVFLLEYAITGSVNKILSGKLIIMAFLLSLLILTITTGCIVDFDAVSIVLIVLSGILFIYGLWVIFTCKDINMNVCEWKRSDGDLLGHCGWLFMLLLFLTLFYLSFKTSSTILGIICMIILIISGYILLIEPLELFWYYFPITLLLMFLIYWCVPYYDSVIHESIAHEHKLA